jgi:hypothetical protein
MLHYWGKQRTYWDKCHSSYIVKKCPAISSAGSKYMFADDTSIYCSGKSVDEVTCMLYMALRELLHWRKENSLVPHPNILEEAEF